VELEFKESHLIIARFDHNKQTNKQTYQTMAAEINNSLFINNQASTFCRLAKGGNFHLAPN